MIKIPIPTNTSSDGWYGAELNNLSNITPLTFDGPNAITYTGDNVAVISVVSYTNNTPTYIKGTAIINNIPTISPLSATPKSFSIQPSIDSTGLTFNSSTGVISGTPTSTIDQTYTIKVLNATDIYGNNYSLPLIINEPVISWRILRTPTIRSSWVPRAILCKNFLLLSLKPGTCTVYSCTLKNFSSCKCR